MWQSLRDKTATCKIVPAELLLKLKEAAKRTSMAMVSWYVTWQVLRVRHGALGTIESKFSLKMLETRLALCEL
jgi:hypothetical protein